MRKFQFLIGRLATGELYQARYGKKVFQFLIGRLATVIVTQ